MVGLCIPSVGPQVPCLAGELRSCGTEIRSMASLFFFLIKKKIMKTLFYNFMPQNIGHSK